MPLRVFITGASSGIGKAIAQRLHQEGWVVWGTSRNQPDSNWPAGVHHAALDVTDAASVRACIAHVITHAGRMDLVVNNAGVTLLGAMVCINDGTVQNQ